MSSKHLGAVPISIGSLWLDVDGPGHVVTPEWRVDLAPRIARLRTDQPAVLDYPTRGGHRVLWPLAESFELRDRTDAREWKRRYLAECDRLATDYGIIADRRCADPFRLFRLPNVVRSDAPVTRHSLDSSWAPSEAKGRALESGALLPIPSEDVEASRHFLGSDLGRLFDLCVERGLAYAELADPSEQGARRFAVHCPHEAEHSSGRQFAERDCILIAGDGISDGWICCSHRTCDGRTQADFMARLKASPLREAAAGAVKCNAIEALPDEPSDSDLLALRLGGRDEFSTIGLDGLRELHGIDELWGHAYEAAALRWVGRGLSVDLAVRWAEAMKRRWAA